MPVHSALLAVASLALVLSAGHEVVQRADAAPVVSVDAGSPEWAAQVEWGLGRFRAAGLQLPPLAISVHDTKSPCRGNSGLYHPAEPAEIRLCTSRPAGSGTAELITLHELAHAWAETQLTDEQRMAFLRLRGLETWADRERPPHEWGAEHAAEVISWGLMDEMGPIIRIDDAEPAALLAAFEQLTGSRPLWEAPPLGAIRV